jgi:hypothetical protein
VTREEFIGHWTLLSAGFPPKADADATAETYYRILGPCFTERQWARAVEAALTPALIQGPASGEARHVSRFQFMPSPSELLILGEQVAGGEGSPALIGRLLAEFGGVVDPNEVRAAVYRAQNDPAGTWLQRSRLRWQRQLEAENTRQLRALIALVPKQLHPGGEK